jgi:hypothetical protein
MTGFNRLRRVDISSLRVGQVIRSKVFYQSRTGMIVRIWVRGRIEKITSEEMPTGQPPSFVEGLLRDKDGITQSFRLTRAERVYRKLDGEEVASRLPAPSRVPDEGDRSRDAEQAS